MVAYGDRQGESRVLLRLAALYKSAVELGVVLVPLACVGYLYIFQDPPQLYHDHLVHEVAIAVAIALSLFAAWMAYRCFLASGEPTLRYVTLALVGFAVVYAPHGILTRFAESNIWLFVLYGPASRVVMTAFLLEALTRQGEAPEPVERRRDPVLWGGWLAAVVAVDVAVAALATLPVADNPHIRLTMEGLAITLSLGGIVAIRWQKLASGLMWSYQVALLAFAASSFTFLLTGAWTHLWWLAHGIFAAGFFLLSHGLARTLLTTRSIAAVHSEQEMVARITEAEAAIATAREAEGRLRQLFDSSPVGVMVTAPDGSIRFCNRHHAQILGLTPEDVCGRDVADFVADPGLSRRCMDEALATGLIVSAEVQCLPVWGERRWYMVSWTPLIFEGRQALVWWATDITDRHCAAEELHSAKQAAEMASRAKTEFLAAMSHELRTPLTAINGFAESMQAEILGPMGNERYREYCGHIVDAAHHLAALVNDVLDVARVESGKVALREELVEPAALIHAALAMVGDRARQARVDVRQDIGAALPILRADPLRLKQVLLNLLTHAVKFTPEGSHITVRGGVDDDNGVFIEVEDNGTVISPQGVDMGLGLSLARSLMDLHGGRLDVGRAAGQGARVRLCFPPERSLMGADVIPLPDTACG